MIRLLERLPGLRPSDDLIISNNRYFNNFNKTKPLREYDFVVYDTELTGLDIKKNEIISIGAVCIKDLQISLGETFHYYVRPSNLEHTDATLVHRITPEQLKQAPPLEEVLPKFLSFIGASLLVGHFIEIDMGFLNRATRRLYRGTVANPRIDTRKMAQIYKQSSRGYIQANESLSRHGYNLQELSKEFNLPFFDAHDALEDALQTAYLFLFLVKKIESLGLLSLDDLFQAGRGLSWATMEG
jgi:DNA polymerase-3 subunit epsilon